MKNSINTYPYDIAAIILAYLRSEIDEKGQQKLDAWLEEADSHKALFARIQDEAMQYEDIQKILSYDAGGAWQIVKQKAARRRRKRLMRVYQVAVSVVVVLGVAIAFLLKEEATVVPVAKVEEITPGRSIAKLTVASGDVYHLDSLNQVDLVTSLAENNGKEVVFTDRQLEESVREIRYNKVEIPRGGEYQIVLGDGTRVYLNAQTELRFPESFANSEQRLVYLSGEAYFEVAADPDRLFVVEGGGVVVKVHGTVFNMKAREKQDHVDVSLLSGLVVVENHGVSRSLNPGETAVCKKSVPSIEKKTTDVSISCLWAKESLRFEKKTIYELTGYLSEWYGMDIRLDPSLPTDQAYTFTITHESLEEVLCLIAKITPIEYVFDEDNTVRITRK